MNTEKDILNELDEDDPFRNGAGDKYKLPVSQIAKHINNYISNREGYPKYKVTTVEKSDLNDIKEFLNDFNFPFLELDLDPQKISLKKYENQVAEFFYKNSASDAVFIFGLEALADGKPTKAKTMFIKMLIYYASRRFQRENTIFLISIRDFIGNIRFDDEGWFAGRLTIFDSYTDQRVGLFQ